MSSLIQYIVERLENTKLFEMAYNRAKYIDKVDNLLTQLIENWCLVRYCSVFDKDNLNRNHWKKELVTHIAVLNRCVVQTDKRRATYQAIIDYPETHSVEQIILIISKKWNDENLDIDSNATTSVCTDCAEYGVDDLVEQISFRHTYQEIKDYVNSI